MLRELKTRLPEIDPKHFIDKRRDQDSIIRQELDLRVFQKAFRAFSSLSHIQILRVQDYEDGTLLKHLRQNHDLVHVIEPAWPPACFHSTKTIGTAVKTSGLQSLRFSSPMLSTHSARDLAQSPPRKILGVLVKRLTSLELHFDDSIDLDRKMSSLSGLFREVLTAAENLEAIHIGFPSHYPLNLPLEELFHDIKWKKLQAFGIQAWKLNASEIIRLVRRHREKLRGLRLRDVLLKDGSTWKEVLQVLREEMSRLDWVSLRRIGYARRFEEQMAQTGIEIEDVPGGDSESSNEDDDFSSYTSDMETSNDSHTDTDMGDDSDMENAEDNEENGPHANDMSFPQLSDDPRSICNCNGQHPLSVEELGDDGFTVSNSQRKLWERWCTHRCNHGTNQRAR